MGDASANATTTVRQHTPGDRQDLPRDLREAIEFHGHLCPGLTIGYRAARICMDRLGVECGTDEQLVGIVENDACGVDAFQFITGCTLGKGNLVYKDYGKQAFTLVRRADGRGIRVALRPEALERDPDQAALRARVMTGQADDEERALFWELHEAAALAILEAPADRIACVAEVEVQIPDKARIFDSVVCSVCGEAVMEPRSRNKSGEPCCIPCADRYGRGWEINE